MKLLKIRKGFMLDYQRYKILLIFTKR
jgi:hypothetical protein